MTSLQFKNIFFLLSLICFGASCDYVTNKPKSVQNCLINIEEPEFLRDNDFLNKNISDNKIFESKKVFVYSFNFFVDEKESFCWVGCNDSLRVFSRLDSKGEKADYKLDKIKLTVYNGHGNTSLGKNQTIVKYDYFSDEKKIFLGEKTGIKESDDVLFIHPPRSHCFITTMLHPFPYIKKPLTLEDSWESSFVMPSYLLEEFKINSLDYISIPDAIDIKYSVKELVKRRTKWGEIDCYFITAEGLVNEKTYSTSSFLYNDEYGFIDMKYENLSENTKLEIYLKDIQQ